MNNGSPSWQARALRVATRLGMKPFVRFGSIRALRGVLSVFDAALSRIASDARLNSTFRVSSTAFGEFLDPQGIRPARVIVYLPGGAFFGRSPNAHRLLVQRICSAAGARAVIVHYRLAPEHKYPAALEDAVSAYRRLLAEGVDSRRIVIAGDSAGGCLALAAALALRDLGEQMPAALVTISPLTDLTFSGGSRRTNRWKDPMLSATRSAGDARHYLGMNDPRNPLISPVFGDFDGLPPVLAQVGSDEILLDDTLRVAERARSAGIEFAVEVWRRMPHVWHLVPQLPESRRAIQNIGQFIREKTAGARTQKRQETADQTASQGQAARFGAGGRKRRRRDVP